MATAALAAQLCRLPVYVTVDSEDGYSEDPAKVAAVKRSCPDMFVNVRVDNFWFGEQATADAVLRRARLYADAGSDGIFVPGVAVPEDIRSITAGIELPVNVLAHPSLTVAELGALRVRRVSSGSLPYRASVDSAVNVANALRDGKPTPSATSYWEMQTQLVAFNNDTPN